MYFPNTMVLWFYQTTLYTNGISVLWTNENAAFLIRWIKTEDKIVCLISFLHDVYCVCVTEKDKENCGYMPSFRRESLTAVVCLGMLCRKECTEQN